MGRNCYVLQVGGNEYKLRLTLKGQKNLKAKNKDPNASMIGIVMEALDDPITMSDLLTEALSWDGNKNKIRSGEALYDEMVDAGYCGTEKWVDIVLGIAHNAGLLSEEDRARVERSTKRMLRRGMEGLDVPDEDEEDEESPENPPEEYETL